MLVNVVFRELAEEGLDLGVLFGLTLLADDGTDDTVDAVESVSHLSFCLLRDGLKSFIECNLNFS